MRTRRITFDIGWTSNTFPLDPDKGYTLAMSRCATNMAIDGYLRRGDHGNYAGPFLAACPSPFTWNIWRQGS